MSLIQEIISRLITVIFMRGAEAMAGLGQEAASVTQVHQAVTRVARREEREAQAEVGAERAVSIEAQALPVHLGRVTGRPAAVVAELGVVRRVYVVTMEIHGVVGTVVMDV